MRKIELLIIHCADTPPSMDIGAREIRQWHLDRGWHDIGYHYVIRRNGEVEIGRPEAEVGAHVYGHNDKSIGICLVGGMKADGRGSPEVNYTAAQWDSLKSLTVRLKQAYPEARCLGHCDLDSKKTCPNFNVRAWAGVE